MFLISNAAKHVRGLGFGSKVVAEVKTKVMTEETVETVEVEAQAPMKIVEMPETEPTFVEQLENVHNDLIDQIEETEAQAKVELEEAQLVDELANKISDLNEDLLDQRDRLTAARDAKAKATAKALETLQSIGIRRGAKEAEETKRANAQKAEAAKLAKAEADKVKAKADEAKAEAERVKAEAERIQEVNAADELKKLEAEKKAKRILFGL